MKKHLVTTLSLTLLLSTPLAMHAVRTKAPLIQDSTPCHTKGLNPFQQRVEQNKAIATLEKTIENLKNQRDSINPKKNEITLASSVPGRMGMSKAASQLAGLETLAAQTATLLKEKEAALAAEKAKLPALDARIKTLKPSEDKLELFHKYQQAIAPIGIWSFNNTFKYCATTKVGIAVDEKGQPQKGEDGKIIRINSRTNTVATSDKSAPYLPTQEEYTAIVAERQKAREASWLRFGASLVVTLKTIPDATNKVVLAPATSTIPVATQADDNK